MLSTSCFKNMPVCPTFYTESDLDDKCRATLVQYRQGLEERGKVERTDGGRAGGSRQGRLFLLQVLFSFSDLRGEEESE
jgi:hypothetical protein